MQSHSTQNSNNKSHRKKKAHKSESEEYDSLGSDTESGSGGRTRNRIDHSIHLDELEPPSFISMYKHSHNIFFLIRSLSNPSLICLMLKSFSISFTDKTPHKIVVNYRL